MIATMDKLNTVFQNVFNDDELTIDEGTTAGDVEGWDSLMHVTLLVNVEKAFGIKFTSSEVAGMKSVGDLARLIGSRASR
jgi:acyl carrier protein